MLNTAYYHNRINRTLRFLIPPHKTVLYYGQFDRHPVANLQAERCVFVDQPSSSFPAPETPEAGVELVRMPFEQYEPRETFDYIVLNSALGEVTDICRLLKNIQRGCAPSTRVVIYQHNYMWQYVINLAQRLGLKRKDRIQNWLSLADLNACLTGLGFRKIRTFRQTICPVKFLLVGPLLNFLADLIPLFDLLKLDQFILARPGLELTQGAQAGKSLSIVLTVRDEKGNVEPIVRSLPQVCADQEIVFVEGHSTDGTAEEIERVAAAFPEKNIRLLRQPGQGQADAIRTGFRDSAKDILILYEGDGTSDPADIGYFYKAICSGRFDFVEGSRFIYPLDGGTMPLTNRIGNIFFAKWFSWFLGQHATDVLSGIKACSRREFALIDRFWGFLKTEDPFGDFELLYGAFRFGLNFCEIPIHYRPRPYGRSKTRVFRHGFYLLRMAARGYILFRRADAGRKAQK